MNEEKKDFEIITPIERRQRLLDTPLKKLKTWQIWNEFSHSNQRLTGWED